MTMNRLVARIMSDQYDHTLDHRIIYLYTFRLRHSAAIGSIVSLHVLPPWYGTSPIGWQIPCRRSPVRACARMQNKIKTANFVHKSDTELVFTSRRYLHFDKCENTVGEWVNGKMIHTVTRTRANAFKWATYERRCIWAKQTSKMPIRLRCESIDIFEVKNRSGARYRDRRTDGRHSTNHFTNAATVTAAVFAHIFFSLLPNDQNTTQTSASIHFARCLVFSVVCLFCLFFLFALLWWTTAVNEAAHT